MDEIESLRREIDALIDGWCERRELGPLSVLLASWLSNNGLTDGWGLVMEDLRTLRASRGLPDDEQLRVERALIVVESIVYRS